MKNIKEGDIVIKHNGKKPIRVVYVGGFTSRGRYIHNDSYVEFRNTDVKLYEEEGQDMNTNPIYEVKLEDGSVKYGRHAGTHSSGAYLMEIDGSIVVVSKDKVTEVLPYTFEVRMNGKNSHYRGVEGGVKKGDILIYTGSGSDHMCYGHVVAVDTKNKSAAKEFKGERVITEKIALA